MTVSEALAKLKGTVRRAGAGVFTKNTRRQEEGCFLPRTAGTEFAEGGQLLDNGEVLGRKGRCLCLPAPPVLHGGGILWEKGGRLRLGRASTGWNVVGNAANDVGNATNDVGNATNVVGNATNVVGNAANDVGNTANDVGKGDDLSSITKPVPLST